MKDSNFESNDKRFNESKGKRSREGSLKLIVSNLWTFEHKRF